jgi:hypothetical protein
MEQKLAEIIDDPEKVKAILALTSGRLSPQQRYMQSDKGKEAKRKSNAKYNAKSEPDKEAVRKWLTDVYADRTDDKTEHYMLSDYWDTYTTWAGTKQMKAVKRPEFKDQLAALAVPTATSYMCEGKRIHRKVYVLNTPNMVKLLATE